MAVVENQEQRVRPDAAGQVERVLARARFLGEQDRTIIEMLAKGNLSRREVARLVGISPSSLTRRVQRLASRLHDPIVVALIDGDKVLPPEYRQLGLEHFLQGHGPTKLAEMHRISMWEVRRMLGHIRGWFEGQKGR
jgi:hypothetical protein